MSSVVPDLWPDDIAVNILPPAVILRAQEAALGEKTQGMLKGQMSRVESGDLISYQLDLLAPDLNYRERLLTATHEKNRYYPLKVEAAAFCPDDRLFSFPASPLSAIRARVSGEPLPTERRAATDQEFIGLVRDVLRSDSVRSLIQSLIARINEKDGTEPLAG